MGRIDQDDPHMFFFEQLERVLVKERIQVSAQVQIYLAGMLRRPAYHGEDVVHTLLEKLAPQYLKAISDGSADQLRSVGDQALLLRGFWWQYAERAHNHGTTASYYEEIGQRAYLLVHTELCDELAYQFTELCQVLALLWSQTAVRTDEDLLMLYRFWMHTKSQYAQAILQRHGLPVGNAPS